MINVCLRCGPIHHQSEKRKNEAKNTKEVSGLDFSLCIFVAFWATNAHLLSAVLV